MLFHTKGNDMHIPSLTNNFFHNILEAKRVIIHKINPEKYNYVLKSKTDKCKISKAKNLKLPIPEGADTFRTVHIGKRDDAQYSKVITTFYKNNQIMKRYINDCGEVTSRVYTQKRVLLDASVKAFFRTVKTFGSGVKNNLELQKIEHIELSRFPHSGKIKFKLHKDENVYDGSQIRVKIKEHENLPYRKPVKKAIELNMEFDKDGIPHILNQSVKGGIKLPENDKFLPLRFIFDLSKQRLAFTKYFIKKYHLENLGIKIDDALNLPNKTVGEFCPEDILIRYDKDYGDILALTAHEVRHAYQFAQIGRLGKGCGKYYRNAERQLGAITNTEEAQEAYRFFVASEKYPHEADIERKSQLYTGTYLEIDARKAESEAMIEYSEGARVLASQIGRYI